MPATNYLAQPHDCGIYHNGYNVKAGAIVAIENVSPEYCAGQVENPPTGAALAALVPDINRWSDVVFGIWADTAGSVMSHGLDYIFRDNVVNDDTKHIMDVVMGLGNDVAVGNLHATYPGREFSTDTWQGQWTYLVLLLQEVKLIPTST